MAKGSSGKATRAAVRAGMADRLLRAASAGERSDEYYDARVFMLTSGYEQLGIKENSDEAVSIRSALSGIAYWSDRRDYTEGKREYDQYVEEFRKLMKK